jgi:hypothetical protein
MNDMEAERINIECGGITGWGVKARPRICLRRMMAWRSCGNGGRAFPLKPVSFLFSLCSWMDLMDYM